MKKYIATIAITGTAEVELDLTPEEIAEYENLSDPEDKTNYVLDRSVITHDDIDYSDGVEVIFLEES